MFKQTIGTAALAALLATSALYAPAFASEQTQVTQPPATTPAPEATPANPQTQAPATEDQAPPKNRAVINFANFRGQINDWRAEGTKAIMIQSLDRKWYRAEFMAPCFGLPFTQTIGFVTDGLNQIDRFSSIVIRGHERCWFKSFEEVQAPAKKSSGSENPK